MEDNFLIEELKRKQRDRQRKTLLFTFIPIITVILFMVYTLKVVSKGREEISELKLKRNILKHFIDSIRRDSTTRFATRFQFTVLNCDTIWQQKQLLDTNKTAVEESKRAYNLLNEIKKKPIPFHLITIRYYKKTIENDKIFQSLARSGFSWILVKEDSEDNKVFCNSIHYSKFMSEDAIKVAALALIEVGLEVKEIKPYSGKHSLKLNSIEIGDIDAQKLPSITVDSIRQFHVSN